MRFFQTLWRFLISIQLLPALEGGEETLVGGQAVLEGVMMRSPHAWAITCRKPTGELSTYSEPLERLSEEALEALRADCVSRARELETSEGLPEVFSLVYVLGKKRATR